MFFVTFLSDKDREHLAEVDEKLSNVIDLNDRNSLFTEKAEIEAKRKPLNQCTLDECNELNSQLHAKLQLLTSSGKRLHASQFQTMINLVGNRMQAVMMETAKEDAEKEANRQAGKVPTDDEKSQRSAKARSFSSKWSIGADDFD